MFEPSNLLDVLLPERHSKLFQQFARFIVVLVPLILLLPAILLYVGSRARAYKEAQANVSVLLFVVWLLPVIQLFLQR